MLSEAFQGTLTDMSVFYTTLTITVLTPSLTIINYLTIHSNSLTSSSILRSMSSVDPSVLCLALSVFFNHDSLTVAFDKYVYC